MADQNLMMMALMMQQQQQQTQQMMRSMMSAVGARPPRALPALPAPAHLLTLSPPQGSRFAAVEIPESPSTPGGDVAADPAGIAARTSIVNMAVSPAASAAASPSAVSAAAMPQMQQMQMLMPSLLGMPSALSTNPAVGGAFGFSTLADALGRTVPEPVEEEPPAKEPHKAKKQTKKRASSGPPGCSKLRASLGAMSAMRGETSTEGACSSAPDPMMKPGGFRKFSCNDNVVLVSEAMYRDWGLSSFLDTKADYQKKLEKQAKDAGARQLWLVQKNPSLNDEDAETSRALAAYEVILEGVASIQAEWNHYQTHLDSDRALQEIDSLHELLNSNLQLKRWWQNGRFTPPWEKELFDKLKVTWQFKQKPVEIKNVVLLICADVAVRICPDEIVRRLPTEYPQYLPETARKPELLATHWEHWKSQHRLYDHALKQNHRTFGGEEASLRSSMQKLFVSSFPTELGDLSPQVVITQDPKRQRTDGDVAQDVGGDAAAGAGEQEDPFANMEVDFAAFDGAMIDQQHAVEEAAAPASTTCGDFLVEDLLRDARLILACIWPERFMDVLGEAVETAHAEKPTGWFATMRESRVYVKMCNTAKEFHGKIIKFNEFRGSNNQTMLDFSEFADKCKEYFHKLSQAESIREQSRIVLEWNKNVSKSKLVPLRLMQSVLTKLHEEYSGL